MRTAPVAAPVAALVLAALTLACTSDGEPGATASATGEATATPTAVATASPRDAALVVLSTVPGVAEAVAAVAASDVDALLALFYRAERTCLDTEPGDENYDRQRRASCAVAGVAAGETFSYIAVDEYDTPGALDLVTLDWWAEAPMRELLRQALAGPVELASAQRYRYYRAHPDGVVRPQDRYTLYYRAPDVDISGRSRVRDDSRELPADGFALSIEAGEAGPISTIAFVRLELLEAETPFALDVEPLATTPNVDADEAAAARAGLALAPGLSQVVAAIERGDVDALIDLFARTQIGCAPVPLGKEQPELCSTLGLPDSALYDAIMYDYGILFHAGEQRIRAVLEPLLRYGQPTLEAAWFAADRDWGFLPEQRDRYLIAIRTLPVEFLERDGGGVFGGGPVSGLLLNVVARRDAPIATIQYLSPGWTAQQQVRQLRIDQPLRRIEPVRAPTGPITIAAVGDLMLARDVAELMEARGAVYPFERVLPLFEGADLVVGNLEGTFTTWDGARAKRYTFRTPPALAAGLADAGFDAVSLANNHSCDFGGPGLHETQHSLTDAGIRWFGADITRVGAASAASLVAHGATVTFLGYNAVPDGDTGGIDDGCYTAELSVLDEVRARAASGEIVIFTLHAGIEYDPQPARTQRELAQAAIDAGAKLVIGTHPHVLQGWERYGGGVILYSLGNFVFDLDADDLATLGRGPFETAVALVTIDIDGTVSVEFRPVVIDLDELRPRPATAAEAARIAARVFEIVP